MMQTSSTMVWIEFGAAVLLGGLLLLLLVGLFFMRRARSTGPRRPMGMFWNRIEARFLGARSFVEVDHLDPQQTLTIQGVIARGWTPKLVEEVLGLPDYAVLDPQRKQEPFKLYDLARVERAEQGKKFRSHRAQVAREQAHSEARIRKWLELRGREQEGTTTRHNSGSHAA